MRGIVIYILLFTCISYVSLTTAIPVKDEANSKSKSKADAKVDGKVDSKIVKVETKAASKEVKADHTAEVKGSAEKSSKKAIVQIAPIVPLKQTLPLLLNKTIGINLQNLTFVAIKVNAHAEQTLNNTQKLPTILLGLNLTNETINDSLIKKAVPHNLIDKPVNESLIEKGVPHDLLDKPVNESLIEKGVPHDLLDKPVKDSLLEKSVPHDLLDKPVKDSLLEKSVPHNLLDSPVKDSLIEKGVPHDLIDRPVNDTLLLKPITPPNSSLLYTNDTVNQNHTVDTNLTQRPIPAPAVALKDLKNITVDKSLLKNATKLDPIKITDPVPVAKLVLNDKAVKSVAPTPDPVKPVILISPPAKLQSNGKATESSMVVTDAAPTADAAILSGPAVKVQANATTDAAPTAEKKP